jgi:hypothetical protein
VSSSTPLKSPKSLHILWSPEKPVDCRFPADISENSERLGPPQYRIAAIANWLLTGFALGERQ